MKKYKAFLISIDGLGDHPVAELGGLTPLEAATRPNLNLLAKEGVLGIVDPFAPGVPCGTDVGHLCMLGYSTDIYSGRGPIEAVGAGITLSAGDVAFRCNFATVDETGIVIDRRAGRIRDGVEELSAALDGMNLGEGITANFAPATEHRAVLVLRGHDLSANVSDSDPGGKNVGQPIQPIYSLDDTPEAERTAKALQSFLDKAQVILDNHAINLKRVKCGLPKANAILTRGGGVMTKLVPLKELYKGFKGAVVSGEKTVLAIAKMVGFDIYTNKSMTGSYDFDPRVKATAALEQIKNHDLVLVHVKATDLAGHDGRWDWKKDVIERIDILIGILKENIAEDVYIAVTADHSTPCRIGEHSGDPVPALIWGPGIRVDAQETFGERSCAGGGLGRLNGNQFFSVLIDLMGFSKKMGA